MGPAGSLGAMAGGAPVPDMGGGGGEGGGFDI